MIKQLLNLHDIKNYQASVCHYQPCMSSTWVDNDKRRLGNSSYHVYPHSIIVNYSNNDGLLWATTFNF